MATVELPRDSEIATKLLHQVDRIGSATALDQAAQGIDRVVRPRLDQPAIRRALSGVPLGHRVHPPLTDVTIGSFMAAGMVDLIAPRHRSVARRLIGIGILSALPTAATGLSDWLDLDPESRRIGLVHAAGNSAGLLLFTRSYLRHGKRRLKKGRRGRGGLSMLAGMAVMGASSYLGGHLAYVRGAGVDHTAFEPRIEEWTDVASVDELAEGSHRVAHARTHIGTTEVLLVREPGSRTVRALQNRCTHAGWHLDQGKFVDGCVTCPGHGSQFFLEDGAVVHGPASSPEPVYDVREVNGRIEVRSRIG